MHQMEKPATLSQNSSPRQQAQKPKWYKNLSLATGIALAIFILSNTLGLVAVVFASKYLLAPNAGLAGFLIFIIIAVVFIYITVILPLWILLLRKLFQHSIKAAAISIVLQPWLANHLVGALFIFFPHANNSFTFFDRLEIVISLLVLVGVGYIFYQEFKYNRELKNNNLLSVSSEKMQKQSQSAPQTIKEKVSLKSHFFIFIFMAVIAFINFAVFQFWYGIASLPFVYVLGMNGSDPFHVSFFGVSFSPLYMVLLFEVPIAAFIFWHFFKKTIRETYLNTLLQLLLITVIIVIFSIISNPHQVSISNTTPVSVARTYDFSKRIILNNAHHAVGDIALGNGMAAWDEYVKASPENIWDTFLFEYDSDTGGGKTTRITNREFSPRINKSADRGSLKIINGKVYWMEEGTNGTKILFRYDPFTQKTAELDPNASEYTNQCKVTLNSDGTVSYNSYGSKGIISDTVFDYYTLWPLSCSDKYIIYGFSQLLSSRPSGFAVYNISDNKIVYQDTSDNEVDNARLFGDVLYYQPLNVTKVYSLIISTKKKQIVLENNHLFSWDTDGRFILYSVDANDADPDNPNTDLYLEKLSQ